MAYIIQINMTIITIGFDFLQPNATEYVIEITQEINGRCIKLI